MYSKSVDIMISSHSVAETPNLSLTIDSTIIILYLHYVGPLNDSVTATGRISVLFVLYVLYTIGSSASQRLLTARFGTLGDYTCKIFGVY